MLRVRVLAAICLAAGCGSSKADDSGTSASEVATGDAGDAAVASGACVPCSEQFPAGAKKYDSARRSCVCTDEVCYEACRATQCAHDVTAPDATCGACIDTNYGSCVRRLTVSCEADSECTKYVLCKVDSTCEPAK